MQGYHKLVYGNISEIDEAKGFYRVELDEYGVVTDWMPRMLLNTLENKDEAHFDVNEHVACLVDEFCEDGIILGALNDDTAPPADGSSKDIRRTTFKDGSFISFDRSSGEYEINVKGDCKITSDKKVLVSSTDGIELGGNSNGGIPKTESVKNTDNELIQAVNELKNIMALWVPVPNDGGAALKTAVTLWASNLLVAKTASTYKNDNVKM